MSVSTNQKKSNKKQTMLDKIIWFGGKKKYLFLLIKYYNAVHFFLVHWLPACRNVDVIPSLASSFILLPCKYVCYSLTNKDISIFLCGILQNCGQNNVVTHGTKSLIKKNMFFFFRMVVPTVCETFRRSLSSFAFHCVLLLNQYKWLFDCQIFGWRLFLVEFWVEKINY